MKKKKLVIGSLFGVAILIVFLIVSIEGWCNFNFLCQRPHDDSVALILFPIVPLFIFSLITFKMREEIWETWWKFARVWTPLSMLVILFSPSTGNWMIPIEKGSVAFVSMCTFAFISIVLILMKYSLKRKEKQNCYRSTK